MITKEEYQKIIDEIVQMKERIENLEGNACWVRSKGYQCCLRKGHTGPHRIPM